MFECKIGFQHIFLIFQHMVLILNAIWMIWYKRLRRYALIQTTGFPGYSNVEATAFRAIVPNLLIIISTP